MAIWLDRLGELLLDASLAATALLSLVALAMIGCRQPVRRIFLARTALIAVLALLPLIALSPSPRIPIRRVACKSGILAHPIFSHQDHRSFEADADAERFTKGQAVSSGREALPLNAPVVCNGLHIGPLPRWLVLLYLAGATTSLAWLLLGHWGLNWLTSRSDDVSPASAALYESLPVEGSVRRPRLRVSQRVRRPVLVGLLQPTILIPAELDVPESADKLRLSLLHELAHAERSDSWFGLVSSLAQAFWFFLPPLWWIRAQMRLDQEFLADRRAAQTFGPFQTYAASLVKIASGNPELIPSSSPSKGASPSTPSPLFQRVLMLVRCPFQVEAHPPRWWSFSLACLILLGTIATSRLTLQHKELSGSASNSPSSSSSSQPASPSKDSAHSFRMSRLVVNPPANRMGPPQLYVLPVRLPQAFDLSLEVLGDLPTLAKTKVAGLRLYDPSLLPVEPTPSAPPTWHRVEICLESSGRLSLLLDQRPVPIEPAQTSSSSLSFETPVNAPVHFRNLRLTW